MAFGRPVWNSLRLVPPPSPTRQPGPPISSAAPFQFIPCRLLCAPFGAGLLGARWAVSAAERVGASRPYLDAGQAPRPWPLRGSLLSKRWEATEHNAKLCAKLPACPARRGLSMPAITPRPHNWHYVNLPPGLFLIPPDPPGGGLRRNPRAPCQFEGRAASMRPFFALCPGPPSLAGFSSWLRQLQLLPHENLRFYGKIM